MASPFMEQHEDFVLKLKIKASDGEWNYCSEAKHDCSVSNSVTRLSRKCTADVRVVSNRAGFLLLLF
jgi:hypothetical protein